MSFQIMKRRCPHCGKVFSYNPDTGNLGLWCPHCGKHVFLKPGKGT